MLRPRDKFILTFYWKVEFLKQSKEAVEKKFEHDV